MKELLVGTAGNIYRAENPEIQGLVINNHSHFTPLGVYLGGGYPTLEDRLYGSPGADFIIQPTNFIVIPYYHQITFAPAGLMDGEVNPVVSGDPFESLISVGLTELFYTPQFYQAPAKEVVLARFSWREATSGPTNGTLQFSKLDPNFHIPQMNGNYLLEIVENGASVSDFWQLNVIDFENNIDRISLGNWYNSYYRAKQTIIFKGNQIKDLYLYTVGDDVAANYTGHLSFLPGAFNHKFRQILQTRSALTGDLKMNAYPCRHIKKLLLSYDPTSPVGSFEIIHRNEWGRAIITEVIDLQTTPEAIEITPYSDMVEFSITISSGEISFVLTAEYDYEIL